MHHPVQDLHDTCLTCLPSMSNLSSRQRSFEDIFCILQIAHRHPGRKLLPLCHLWQLIWWQSKWSIQHQLSSDYHHQWPLQHSAGRPLSYFHLLHRFPSPNSGILKRKLPLQHLLNLQHQLHRV